MRALVLADVAGLLRDHELRDSARAAWDNARARATPLLDELEGGPTRGLAWAPADALGMLLAAATVLHSGASWSVVPWNHVAP